MVQRKLAITIQKHHVFSFHKAGSPHMGQKGCAIPIQNNKHLALKMLREFLTWPGKNCRPRPK